MGPNTVGRVIDNEGKVRRAGRGYHGVSRVGHRSIGAGLGEADIVVGVHFKGRFGSDRVDMPGRR